MRKLSTITIVPLITPEARSFARRPVSNYLSSLTCVVLMRLHQTQLALKVTATGDPEQFAWVQKRIVDVSNRDFGPFLVVTMTHQLAASKRLYTNFTDHSRFPDHVEQLLQAKECAQAHLRNLQRGRGHGGNPNAFA